MALPTNFITRPKAPCTTGRGTRVKGGGSRILSRTSVRHCSFVLPGARPFIPPLASDQASVVLSARSKTSLSCPLAAFICSAVTLGGKLASVSSG